MDNKALLQYLKDAIEQETAIAQQEQMIAEYDRQSEMRKPQLVVERTPALPTLQKVRYPGSGLSADSPEFSLLVVYLTLCGGAVFLGGIFWMAEVFILGIIAFAPYLMTVLSTYLKNRNLVAAHQQACKGVNKQKEAIRQHNLAHRQEFEEHMYQWEASNHAMNAHMAKPLAESRITLFKFYNSDMIYAKYRNLPALTSIYEYFITGRCTELTGPHGAYNMYEDEVRKDTVISQLNTVIENLEQIKQNQYMLYQQVKAIQENTSIIASELRQIKGYTVQIAQLTALNAYYAALNERNTRITMYYHL